MSGLIAFTDIRWVYCFNLGARIGPDNEKLYFTIEIVAYAKQNLTNNIKIEMLYNVKKRNVVPIGVHGSGSDPGLSSQPASDRSHKPRRYDSNIFRQPDPRLQFPAAEHHRTLVGSAKLYCLVTEAHGCKHLVAESLRADWEWISCNSDSLPIASPRHHQTNVFIEDITKTISSLPSRLQ